MKFVCSTFGSSGDVFPMLGLALELRGRGHEVLFSTNQRFEEIALRHGLPFEPLGTVAQYQACIENPDLWHPKRAFRHLFQSLQPALRRQYEIHAEHRDAIGITSWLGLGARVAQEHLGLPVVTVHLQPAVLWSDFEPPRLPGLFGPRWLKNMLYRLGERLVIDPIACPALNAWRRELGLPPMRGLTRWWNSPFAVIGLFPEWYAQPQPDWPHRFIQTDFPLWNDQRSAQAASEVNAFLGGADPPLVFTPGSANVHGRPFFQAAIEACQLLQRRGILLTEYSAQVPKELPDTVVHFPYVPLDFLLPRANAFIHHGGIGSTSQALAAGIPQLIMPLAHDQFDNAHRIKRLGVGTWLPVRRFTGPRLARALTWILGSTQVAASCQEKAKRLESRDGLARAARAIEEIGERL